MQILIFIGECIAIVALVNIVWGVTETSFRRRRARLAAQSAPDWGAMMQAAAEVHLEKVNSAGSREAGVEVDRSDLAFYCGCNSCVVREVLVGAWPVIAMMLQHSCEHDLEVNLTAWHSPHD